MELKQIREQSKQPEDPAFVAACLPGYALGKQLLEKLHRSLARPQPFEEADQRAILYANRFSHS